MLIFIDNASHYGWSIAKVLIPVCPVLCSVFLYQLPSYCLIPKLESVFMFNIVFLVLLFNVVQVQCQRTQFPVE